jgi:hypothetical protein
MAQQPDRRVLFDAGHGQEAGNASWTVEGGYRDFAEALVQAGLHVAGTRHVLTPTVLSEFSVLVLPEPNTNFTDDERAAIVDFVARGGGVFCIGDHAGADRDHDGWDAVSIFNGHKQGQCTPENDWLARHFGYRFRYDWLTQDPITDVRPDPAVGDDVKTVGTWGGTGLEIVDPERVRGVIFLSDGAPYVVVGMYPGGGRMAALGDSSPFDDGDCGPGCRKKLHDNWDQYDHAKLAVNLVRWLAKM